MHRSELYKTEKGFTLIELLVVIAIIAILSIVVILTLNPAALMQQGRDSTRVSDMTTLNTAIGVYAAGGGTSFGNANTVYVSIPDPTATSTAGDQCQGLGLPTLPSTYTYHCAATSTVKNVDSTGWIPINFGSVAIGSSLSQLPLDPTNQSSSRLYYTYTTNGTQFETTAAMESQKYQVGGSGDIISGDGGILASVYEKGSKLGLEPIDYGDSSLVGYWPLNEGASSTAYDDSGNNATGTWSGTQAGTSGYYSAGKGGGYPWAGYFDGNTDVVSPANSSSLNGFTSFTITAWINEITTSTPAVAIVGRRSASTGLSLVLGTSWNVGCSSNQLAIVEGTTKYVGCGAILSPNTWYHVAAVMNGTNVTLYVNGQVDSTGTDSWTWPLATIGIGAQNANPQHPFPGLIDGVRIYNRALSASQIAAMYAGGK